MAQVLMPQRRDSLDEVAKALQIAATGYGIYADYKKLGMAQEAADADKTRQADIDARAQAGEERSAGEYERKRQGILLPAEEAGLQKTHTEVAQGTPGATRLFREERTSDGKTNLLPVYYAAKAPTAKPESNLDKAHADYYTAQAERARKEAVPGGGTPAQRLATERFDYSKNRDIESDTNRLADSINNKGQIVGLVNVLDELERSIPGGLQGKDDIPGFGQTAWAPDRFLTPEGKAVRQNFAAIRNMIIKERAGSAVTDSEAARQLEELGAGNFSKDEDLRRGLLTIKKGLLRQLAQNQAGATPEVLANYLDTRRTGISTNSPYFDDIRKDSAIAIIDPDQLRQVGKALDGGQQPAITEEPPDNSDAARLAKAEDYLNSPEGRRLTPEKTAQVRQGIQILRERMRTASTRRP